MNLSYNAASSEHERNHWQTLRTLGHYLWPKQEAGIKWRVIGAVICLIIAKAIAVYVPFIYKHIIDILNVKNQVILIPVSLIVSYGLVKAMGLAFGELRDLLFVRVGQRAIRASAMEAFIHLHKLPMSFHLDRQTGGLSRVIERAIKSVEFVLGFMLFNIVPTIIEITLICGVLFVKYDVFFSLAGLIGVASYIFFTIYLTEWRLKYRRAMNSADTAANTKAVDSLLNYETVKYFNAEAHERNRYDESLLKYSEAAIHSQKSLSVLNLMQAFIISFASIAMMWLAANRLVAGKMSMGDFVLVNTYIIQLFQPLNFLGFVYRQIRQSLTDMEKMFELLFVTTEQESDSREFTCKHSPAVSFQNVSFAYNPSRTILDDISFSIEPGQTLAIVGPSGSGKSTISRLLYRFYEPASGQILLDGIDVNTLKRESVRKAIGIVPQDTVLFNDTIAYNIAYGARDVSDSDVQRVARTAQIADFIQELPDGYATKVGERGLKLSGGEKQRVAIARTILKDPLILILDEATSALDSFTEKAIQHELKGLSEGRTTLIIAHRLSTIVDADQILVLKAGRVLETGRHQELLDKQGEYAAMWAKQQEESSYQAKLEALHNK